MVFINFDEVSTLLPKFQHCCRYSQFCCPNLERPLDFVRGKSNTVDKATLTALNSTLLRVCTGLTMISTSLGNSGLCWTVFTRNRDTSVPAEGNGDYQTLICVLVARPRRCLTLSNPAPWQNWMAAYLGYTLRMNTLFRGWPVMVHDTHTRKRRRLRLTTARRLSAYMSSRALARTTISSWWCDDCQWRASCLC